MESTSCAFVGSTKSGRRAGDNFTEGLETPTPRRLNLAGAIFRLAVFLGVGTSVFVGGRVTALVWATKAYFDRVAPFGID
jgi:hypothetical protein